MSRSEYNRAWRARNPEKVKAYNARSRAAYQKAWRHENKERVAVNKKAYRELHPEHKRESAKKWAKENYKRKKGYELKRKYGISRQDYDQMLALQGGLCAVCNRPETTIRNGVICELVVDHNHQAGKARKLLCNRCNVALGMLEENADRARQLAVYIDSFKENN